MLTIDDPRIDRDGPIPERVDLGPCWTWKGALSGEGYAQAWDGERQRPAHVLTWESVNGPVPAGLELDHLCRNRGCVRPSHAEPVTHRENLMRSPIAPAAINAAKSECLRGHPFDDANTYRDRRGSRHCRTCHRDREAARRTEGSR